MPRPTRIHVTGLTFLLLVLLVLSPSAVGADPESAPDATAAAPAEPVRPPAEAATVHEHERAEFCAICEGKKRFHELIPWLEMGADLRHRSKYDNNLKLNKNAADRERLWVRDRARVWARVTPLKDLEFNIRAVFEPRYYIKPELLEHQFIRHEALFDILNVRWFNVFGRPLTLTVGRQELKFGDGWLVLEGTPLDGSRTIHFDAARATLDAPSIKTVFDAVFILNHANSSWWIRPFNDRDLDLIEHDEIGAILYASNKSVRNHTIDGYFIYKHDDRVAPGGFNSDIYTFGARVEGRPTDRLTWRGEIAPQFGHKNGQRICTLGFNSLVSYNLKDAWKNTFRAGYEFRGGSGRRDGAFDPLWGRYVQWSNIINGYVDSLEGRGYLSNNLHRLSCGWTFDPCPKLSVATDYHLLFANQNTLGGSPGFSDDGKFRGQLLTCLAKYTFNEHVSTHVLGELFVPGNYYSDLRNDVAVFARWELVFQW